MSKLPYVGAVIGPEAVAARSPKCTRVEPDLRGIREVNHGGGLACSAPQGRPNKRQQSRTVSRSGKKNTARTQAWAMRYITRLCAREGGPRMGFMVERLFLRLSWKASYQIGAGLIGVAVKN